MDPHCGPGDWVDISKPCEIVITTLEQRQPGGDAATDSGTRQLDLLGEARKLQRISTLTGKVWRTKKFCSHTEDQHWSNVSTLMKRCQDILLTFSDVRLHHDARQCLTASPRERQTSDHDLGVPSLQTLCAHVGLFIKVLQITLQIVNIAHQRRQNAPSREIQKSRQSLSDAILDVKAATSSRRAVVYNDPQIDEGQERILLREVEHCSESAQRALNESTMATSKDYETSWPLASGNISPGMKATSPPFSPSPKSKPSAHHFEIRPKVTPIVTSTSSQSKVMDSPTDSDSNTDPEPDFEPSFPPAISSELIRTLREESKRNVQTGNYVKAEESLRKAVEYLGEEPTSNLIPSEEKDQMLENLADIHLKMKEHDKAKLILSPLLKKEQGETNRKWRLYYKLATIYVAQDRLADAEKFAKRSYVGREKALGKGHALISQSAELLIRIYEKQGDVQKAQAFRNLYPDEKIVCLSPQISKHVGTKRVPWNPDISVNMDALTHAGKTLLINAITSGDDVLVQQHLRNGASVEKRCSSDISPIMYAVFNGQVKIAGVLLSRGAQVDATTAGWTPLHKASEQGDLQMMQLLLENGAGIEARSPKKFPPYKNIANRLRRSSDVDFSSTDDDDTEEDNQSSSGGNGWTPLLRAASTGFEEATRLLLSHAANVEARSPSNATPLALASEKHHLPIIDMLLSRAADPNAADDFGWRPLHRIQVLPAGNECALRLLNSGGDINARCVKGMTPLHYAVERGNESMVRLLLQTHSAADLQAQDVAKRTPLHLAIECRLEGMVHLLLECGADVRVKDKEGHDAQQAANHAMRKSPEIVKLLARHVKELKKREAISGALMGGEGAEEPRRKNSIGSTWSGSTITPVTAAGAGGSRSGSGSGERSRSGSWFSRMGKKPR
ncbi:MAG: hypothetical protein OHK93_007394 [Ramalina farinacea]|uniref:Uncharacterized protein n=1 Tax=Ramalina farinacea TaxID=258253 RepID=A0AA43QPM2_9LECA|nr:hypothetical protein [Ramalina farinacea]